MGALDEAIEGMGLSLQELPRPALFLAGKAFVKYRRRGGNKANVLADFFIGAHAAVLVCGILTRDAIETTFLALRWSFRRRMQRLSYNEAEALVRSLLVVIAPPCADDGAGPAVMTGL